MEIKDSFNPKGLGIKQDVKIANHSTVNHEKKKTFFDNLIKIMTNKYLWLVIAIVLALVFRLNVFSE